MMFATMKLQVVKRKVHRKLGQKQVLPLRATQKNPKEKWIKQRKRREESQPKRWMKPMRLNKKTGTPKVRCTALSQRFHLNSAGKA